MADCDEMKTTLVLVRHGLTTSDDETGGMRLNGWTDAPLSEKGIQQAQSVALRLRNEGPFAALYSSPLRRAVDTAGPIAAGINTAPRIWNGLREIHCGIVEGAEVSEVQRRFPWVWAANLEQTDPEFRWPGGESYSEFRSRCIAAIATIAARHHGERVVVVTHAGVVNQVVGHLLGITAARWEPYRPHNATVSEVEWTEGTGRMVRFDDGHHLRNPHTISEISRGGHRLDV